MASGPQLHVVCLALQRRDLAGVGVRRRARPPELRVLQVRIEHLLQLVHRVVGTPARLQVAHRLGNELLQVSECILVFTSTHLIKA